MVAVTMDGPGRDEVLRLIQRKDELEAEIRRLTAILETVRNCANARKMPIRSVVFESGISPFSEKY